MCASSPASTATSGARLRPWAATSQPARASTCWRAAARQVVLAICPPVTIPIPVPAGSPNSPVNQAITVSSTTAAAGESTKRPAFWSHALVSQSAPTAAGRLPPITKPKNRGPAVPTNPGSARFASSSITRPAGSPCSGSGPPRAARIASGRAAAPTGRALTPSRNRTAAACAASRAVRSMLHPNRSGALRAEQVRSAARRRSPHWRCNGSLVRVRPPRWHGAGRPGSGQRPAPRGRPEPALGGADLVRGWNPGPGPARPGDARIDPGAMAFAAVGVVWRPARRPLRVRGHPAPATSRGGDDARALRRRSDVHGAGARSLRPSRRARTHDVARPPPWSAAGGRRRLPAPAGVAAAVGLAATLERGHSAVPVVRWVLSEQLFRVRHAGFGLVREAADDPPADHVHVLAEEVEVLRIRERRGDLVDRAVRLLEALQHVVQGLPSRVLLQLELDLLQTRVPAEHARAHPPPIQGGDDAAEGNDHRDDGHQHDPEPVHQVRRPERQVPLQERDAGLVVAPGHAAEREPRFAGRRELARSGEHPGGSVDFAGRSQQ